MLREEPCVWFPEANKIPNSGRHRPELAHLVNQPIHPQALDSDQLRLVLLVFERPGIVRVQLAEALGMSQATVTGLIRGLISAHVLAEAGQAPSQGGRRATQLSLHPAFLVASVRSCLEGACGWHLVDATGLVREGEPNGDGVDLVAGVAGAGEVSAAEALLYCHPRRTREQFDEFTVCFDLTDAPSAAWMMAGSALGQLDVGELAHTAQICLPDLAGCVGDFGSIDAAVSAEQEGSLEAMRMADAGVAAIGELLAVLARVVRPQRLIFGLRPGLERLFRPEDIRHLLRRRLPKALSDSLVTSFADADLTDRIAGAGLAAIHRQLVSARNR